MTVDRKSVLCDDTALIPVEPAELAKEGCCWCC